MSDLPVEIILPDLPPFTNVGVDYFGPIEIKRSHNPIKRYEVVFTCMTSQALHLEVAHSHIIDSYMPSDGLCVEWSMGASHSPKQGVYTPSPDSKLYVCCLRVYLTMWNHLQHITFCC